MKENKIEHNNNQKYNITIANEDYEKTMEKNETNEEIKNLD